MIDRRPDRPDEAIARGEVLRAWERWAECNYPQDLGDEGGWTEAMLDQFLAWAKRAVMTADDWTGGSREPRRPRRVLRQG